MVDRLALSPVPIDYTDNDLQLAIQFLERLVWHPRYDWDTRGDAFINAIACLRDGLKRVES